jgi:hypothetical protein
MRYSKQRDEPLCDHFRCIAQRASHVHDPQSGLSTLLTVVHYEKNSTSTLRISNRGQHRNSHYEKTALPRCAEIVEQTHVTLGVTPHVGREWLARILLGSSLSFLSRDASFRKEESSLLFTSAMTMKTTYLLTGDVGGTNSRMSLYDTACQCGGKPLLVKFFRNAEYIPERMLQQPDVFQKHIIVPFLQYCWEENAEKVAPLQHSQV